MEKQIGKVNFTKGHVTITDPCYDKGIWCTAEVDNVFKGEWEASVEMEDCGDWGNRIAKLILKVPGQEIVKSIKLPDDIGVDAGVCGVFEDKPDYGDDDWSRLCDTFFMGGFGSIATPDSAFKCFGAWSHSGYGDGSYTATVGVNEAGEVVQIIVDYFTEEEESEDEEDCEDNTSVDDTWTDYYDDKDNDTDYGDGGWYADDSGPLRG